MSFSNSRTMSHIEWIKKDSLIANVPCDILLYLFGDLRALVVDAQRRKIDRASQFDPRCSARLGDNNETTQSREGEAIRTLRRPSAWRRQVKMR